MKMTVLYYSKSGNTKKMAGVIADAMSSVDGVEARAFPLDDVDETFVAESRCVVLGTPIYLASMAGAVKSWLDGPAMKLGLGGKIGGAFATANFLHGGAEIGIQSILSHMMVLGMLAYSGGGAFGPPPIHLGPVALGSELEKSEETFKLYGERMAKKTKELFGA
ncbi:hypothetical protein LJC31_00475 [Synergistaceae bacterium OttesenSCG-928-I11]|nr:hypothetical protein [Synergistaceae bacterium OttesenSCG-928-I11]